MFTPGNEAELQCQMSVPQVPEAVLDARPGGVDARAVFAPIEPLNASPPPVICCRGVGRWLGQLCPPQPILPPPSHYPTIHQLTAAAASNSVTVPVPVRREARPTPLQCSQA